MTSFPFAAVLHAGRGEGNELLWQFCKRLQLAGWRVRGLLTTRGKDPDGRLPMLIRDVHDGHSYAISQPLGPGSLACSLDPGGLAQASAVLRRSLAESPDLVLVNRFGAMEASGRGFAQEMLALMSEGIPLLTLVSPQYQADWQRFTGTPDAILPFEESALLDWANALPNRPGEPLA
ncbi:DUF2478 domain-containing protein [Pseudomonas schmalbachii]|uniref:DUF2478 domain-containing protein n=1 Tax=Pseudomonas schmalbachii TaxID=2816993 RepID=A0ABS3TX08_9PSED|nr:DUF2478 domain-containing protein [Pseudomonas schmalbachii]MBO3278202.1 DUF2478 domain-containing protein [Pseudomonas schmalbachii]